METIHEISLDNGNQAFSKSVRYWMRLKQVKVEELSSRTGLSIDTIKKMRRPKDNQKRFRLKNVIAVAIGLHLPFEVSEKLLKDAGHILREEDTIDKIYMKILKEYYHYSVASCNNYLISLHLSPLTNNDNIFSIL